MRNKINLALIYIFAFFSGFANMPYTKIAGILFFVYIAIFLVFYNWRHKQNAISFNTKQYFWFVIFSVPALFVGLFFLRFDALYFFIYSLLPLLLYYTLPLNKINLNKFLLCSQASLVMYLIIGWMIYSLILPYNFVASDAWESEFLLHYWGVGYKPSTRNHDYMYVFTCACFCLALLKTNINKIVKVIEIVLFFICLITLLATLSRGAMIISAWLLCIFYRDGSPIYKRYSLFFVLIVIIANIGVILSQYQETFKDIFLSIFGLAEENSDGASFSNESRKDIYWNAIVHIIVNPIGYGIQNYGLASDGYGSAENAYLTLFVERGWLAGLFFAKWLITSFWKSNRYTVTYYLSSCFLIYFLFNYEFMSYSNVFIFFIILASHKFCTSNNVKYELSN
ncbi:MAG: O-antigen ligase family protein [Aeriscardovia sp.]|nr:O-antigen ligase family protein [Aeriscardovia sp.]